MNATEAQAIARALTTARAYDDAIFEQVLTEAVSSVLASAFCRNEEDRVETVQRVAALLEALTSLAHVALEATDETVGVPRGTARSRLFAAQARKG